MSKVVLGRGLKALIPSFDEELEKGVEVNSEKLKPDTGEENIIAKIDITKIESNPFQPRTTFDSNALQELKQSIIEKGIIQPITVRRKGENGYELISGERRIRASIEAGLSQIPAYIIKVSSDEEMLELALVENIQREFLSPIETAQAFHRLIVEYKYTHEEIARRVGKDRTTVSNLLRLLKLPEKVKESLEKNEITVGHARALINLPKVEDQIAVWSEIVKKGLSVRKTEKITQSFSENKKPKKKTESAPDGANRTDKSTEYVTSKIRGILGTKVVVDKNRNSESGKITIEFYSDEDLHRLLELFESIQNKIG